METKEVCPCGKVACEELGHPSSHKSQRHEPCPVQVCVDNVVLPPRYRWSLSSLNLGLGLRMVPLKKMAVQHRAAYQEGLSPRACPKGSCASLRISSLIALDIGMSGSPLELNMVSYLAKGQCPSLDLPDGGPSLSLTNTAQLKKSRLGVRDDVGLVPICLRGKVVQC